MRSAWRVADIRSAEDDLLAVLPDGALMARAAAGLARRCSVILGDRRGQLYGSRVVILVGTGNNGGDALYAGALLAGRGAQVVALTTDPGRVHPGGASALHRAGGTVVAGATPGDCPPRADLVIDGLLGIGGRGGLRESAAGLVEAACGAASGDGSRPTLVAVDVPSGVDADTGAATPGAVRADVTVTFGAYKPGLVVGDGVIHSGLVELVDIGLLPSLRNRPVALSVPEWADIVSWWPRPRPQDDKYTRGVVGVATGSATYPGAGVLSVMGALACPVGMVRYAGAAAREVSSRFPTVIATDDVADAGRVQGWTCGCGLGTDQRAAGQMRAVLRSAVPACFDADALTLLAANLTGTGLSRDGVSTVLTPHDREFRRLAGFEPGTDRVGAATRLAARTGAVVLLKGYATIIATPNGTVFVNPTGSPALATAGTGDVLAGIVGALLAAGLAAESAAVAGAYVHGLAGRLAAESGQLTAEDVARKARGIIMDPHCGERDR